MLHIHIPCASAGQLLKGRGTAGSHSRRGESCLPGRCSGRGFWELAFVTDLAPIPEEGGTAPVGARQVGARSVVRAQRAGPRGRCPLRRSFAPT